MAASPLGTLLILVSFAYLLGNANAGLDSRPDELLELQEGRRDGVIRLNERNFLKYARGDEPRSYSLFIFFDAAVLHGRNDLKLPMLRKEFGHMASTFIKKYKDTDAGKKVFFADIEFKESPDTFKLLGVQAVPYLRRIPFKGLGKEQDEMMDPNVYPRTAEGMGAWVEAKSQLPVGPIERPPPLTRTQAGLLLAFILLVGPVAAYKVLSLPMFRQPQLWAAFALAIYFFSVSGGMYNIIRGAPMVAGNAKGELIFFQQGRDQLGFEGFMAGTGYNLVGFAVAAATHMVPRLQSKGAQRFVMAVCIFGGFWLATRVIGLYTWKTGYGVHAFWPTKWQ